MCPSQAKDAIGQLKVSDNRRFLVYADGKPQTWDVRPRPNAGSTVSHDYRAAGFYLGTGAGKPCRDHVSRDCFCSGSAGAGLIVSGPVEGCVIDHVTLRGNLGAQLDADPRAGVVVTDCRIEGKEPAGPGARLTHRYTDGVLTDVPLWPWPMEERIQREMGISVTKQMSELLGLDTRSSVQGANRQ